MVMILCSWCAGTGYFPNNKTFRGSRVQFRRPCEDCGGSGRVPAFAEADHRTFVAAIGEVWGEFGSSIEAFSKRNGDAPMSVHDKAHATLESGALEAFIEFQGKRKARRLKQICHSSNAVRWATEAIASTVGRARSQTLAA